MSTAIATQIEKAFPFNISMVPLQGPDGLKNSNFGLYRDDTWAEVGHPCKKGYVPHQIEDIIALGEAAELALGCESRATCTFLEGHYVLIQPTKGYRENIFGTKDAIWPRLAVRAGYDGKAFFGQLGGYRDLCKNLHIPNAAHAWSRRILHKGRLKEHMDELVVTFRTIAAGWSDLANVARQMEARRVAVADFLTEMYPLGEQATDRELANHKKRTELIVNRIMRERVETGRPNAHNVGSASGWEMYNAIQGYVQHDMTRKGTPDVMTRAILAVGHRDVSRAETLIMATAV